MQTLLAEHEWLEAAPSTLEEMSKLIEEVKPEQEKVKYIWHMNCEQLSQYI